MIIYFIRKIDAILESVAEETMNGKAPLFMLHKAVMTETTSEVFLNNPTTTQSVFTRTMEKNEMTDNKINMITPIDAVIVSPTSTMDQELLMTSAIPLHVEDANIMTKVYQETSTIMVEATTVSTSTETTTSTPVVPADCPTLKDCPFDYCTYARKFDNHGCPTCNCLQARKSKDPCPSLACQECPYGHYTDPQGVHIFLYAMISIYQYLYFLCFSFFFCSVLLVNAKVVRIHH